MKLNNIDLQHLFFSSLREDIPNTRKDCPSPKELLRLLRKKRSEKKKTKVIEHITKCFYCAQEFEFLIKAVRYEKQMNEAAERVITAKKENSSSKNLTNRHISRQLFWKFTPLFAVILGICILIAFYAVTIKSKNPVYRAIFHPQIKLILPENKEISKSSLFFKWEDAMSPDYYFLEVFDETLYRIWKSPKLIENSTKLPNEIVDHMKENKIYFWMITAYFANGKVMESPLQQFSLKE
jgi:hypothetical protein